MADDAAEPSEHPGAARGLRWAGLAAVLATVLLATYLLWPRNPEHVLVVGDSVSYMSMPDVLQAFDGTDVEAVTRPGFTSADLLPLTVKAIGERTSTRRPLDRAIFLVGYNDVWKNVPETKSLDELVEASARYECAVWLTLPARPGGKPPGAAVPFDPDGADAWNERLATLVKRHSNLHLVKDWAEAVDEAPADRYLTADGVHPNRAGMKKLASIMYDSLKSSCRFA
jgi:lysophospholipase L1-like esterase